MSGRSGKEKALVTKYIIVSILVTAFFVGIIFTFYSKLYDEKRTNIIKDGQLSSIQAADLLENYLSTNIDVITLTSYALDEMITEKKSDKEIQDYLAGQSIAVKTAVNENLTGVYGYINGKFFSGVGWEEPEGYDATARPWYTRPMSSPGEITVLDPYVDIQTGLTMLALGKTLCDGVSVVSVDVSLDRIQAITEKATMFENADTEMIINATGMVVAHSDRREIGKDYSTETDTLGAAVYSELRENDKEYFELFFGSSRYIVYAADIHNDWHCISVMDATEVFRKLDFLRTLTVAAVLIIIVIISLIMMNSGRRQLIAEQLNAQLSSTADIYISLHEINFFTDTFSVIRSPGNEVSEIIGKSRHNCQELIRRIMEKCSDASSREEILDFVDFTKLNHRLKDRSTITSEFLSADRKWRRARFIVSERLPSGKVARTMFLVEDIDREKRERDQTLEAVKLMNEQISSVANIYFSMQEIDLRNDTLREIKTKVQRVSELIGGRTEHAQAVMYAVMDQMAHESSKAAIHEFIDLSTLDLRLKHTNTITEEFLSCREVWSRARFIVSKRANDGTIEHVLWLVEGIDAEKRRRDKLIKLSERAIAASEAKSSFLSKMSHNIRTPIHAILGMNELILNECGDKKIKVYSENIRTSGATLLGMVNDILDISGIEAGKTETVSAEYDISCMISDLVNMIQPDAESRGLALILDIGTEIPRMLRGDEVHLKQAIMNLMINAVRSTAEGNVTLCIHYEDITDEPDSIMLDVSVMDTGSGIDPEDADRQNGNEESAESAGSFSVNIAESLLEIMGSSLDIVHEKGEGSVYFFRVKQDVADREPLGNYEESYREAIEKRSVHRAGFSAPEATVLVVDDIPVNLMLMTRLLEAADIRADTALSGERAVRLAKEKKYDIIILDQIMPEKSGVETLREIRVDRNSPNASTPAVCLTANAVTGARERYLKEGFDDYLSKPLDTGKLEEVLMKYLPPEKVVRISGKDE